MSGTRRLTISQQITLGHNPHLWLASVLEDGACLCLDRTAKNFTGLVPANDFNRGPYVLTEDGILINTYHYYTHHYGFTLGERLRQPVPNHALNTLKTKDVLTINEAVNYIPLLYQVRRTGNTLRRWAKRGIVDAKVETLSGHPIWLLDRRSLDEGFLSGRLPIKRGKPKKG